MKTMRVDFVGQRARWVRISAVMLSVALLSLLVRGLNLSIDFVGGSTYVVDNVAVADLDSEELRAAVEAAGAEDVTAQVKTEGDVAIGAIIEMAAIDVGSDTERAIEAAIQEETGATVEDVEFKTVGPSWGRRISGKALQALIVFLIVVVLYITVRLEAKMAGAAMVALAHDLLITIGIYALVGFTVSPSTVIALLTILGYSLYDTVVVFDRVNEAESRLGEPGLRTYDEVVNTSLNDVIWRSINTSLTSLLPVGSLLLVGSTILGASTLSDLALALFIGMAVGTYSSIFVAGPFLAALKAREPEHQARAAALAKAVEAGEAPSFEEVGPVSVVSQAPITTEYVRGTGKGRGKKRKK